MVKGAHCHIARYVLVHRFHAKAVSKLTRPCALLQDAPVYKCAVAEAPTCLSASPNGALLAAGAASGRLYLWDVPTGELLRTWQAHYKAVTCVQWSGDGVLLASAGADSVVHCWDRAAVIDAAAAAAGPGGSGSSGDGGGGGGAQTIQPLVTWSGHSLPVMQVLFSGGGPGLGARVITASLDRTVRWWDPASHKCLLTVPLPAGVSAVALHPLGNVLYCGCINARIYAVEAAAAAATAATAGHSHGAHGGTADGSLPAFVGHTAAITCLSVTGDGLQLVSGSDDGRVLVWDTTTRVSTATYDTHRSPITALRLIQPKPVHTSLAGKQNAMPLAPMSPLRKHMAVVASEWRGSSTGPTDRDAITRVFTSMRSSTAAEDSAHVDLDAVFNNAVSALMAAADVEAQHASAGSSSGTGADAATAAPTATAASADAAQEMEQLRARVATLENENARWQAVNNTLVAKLAGR